MATRRDRLPNKEERSRRACRHFEQLPGFASAHTILTYVHVRSELRTRDWLFDQLARTMKRIVIPCCVGNDLELFELRDFSELEPAGFGLLEPKRQFHEDSERWVSPEEIDYAMIPGVAFDDNGGRVGYGRGYFDRLFSRFRSSTPRIGMGFECQVVKSVPMEDHDVRLHALVTEQRVSIFRKSILV